MQARIASAWVAAIGLTLTFALATKVGPTIIEMAGPHGIHVGDLAVLTISGAAAALASTGAAQARSTARTPA